MIDNYTHLYSDRGMPCLSEPENMRNSFAKFLYVGGLGVPNVVLLMSTTHIYPGLHSLGVSSSPCQTLYILVHGNIKNPVCVCMRTPVYLLELQPLL